MSHVTSMNSLSVMNTKLSALPDFQTLLKNFPRAVALEVGTFSIATPKTPVLTVQNVTTGLAVVMMDTSSKLAGVAHMLLPDDQFQPDGMTLPTVKGDTASAVFVNKALKEMWTSLESKKASPESTKVILAGGSQLFTFGGGGGNR